MTFMSTLDSSIVNVALPAMQRELGVGAADIQWVSSIYLLACCVTVLVFGRLGDRYGKVRFFQVGVALFTAGSALCGLATTLPVLIGARVVQALGAASATANNMGIVTEVFPASQRGRALGITSTFVSLGLMCGPTIGGMLVAVYPWESIFLINVPVGIVAFLVGLKTLPRDAPRTEAGRSARTGFDIAGSLLLAPAIFFTFFSLTNLANGATPLLMGLLAAGLALLVVFVLVERRVEAPLVRLDLFGNAVFSANLAAMFLCFLAVGATEYLLPFFLQDAVGTSRILQASSSRRFPSAWPSWAAGRCAFGPYRQLLAVPRGACDLRSGHLVRGRAFGRCRRRRYRVAYGGHGGGHRTVPVAEQRARHGLG